MKFHIEVDREGCIACATCYTSDPSHFEADDEGKSKIIGDASNGKTACVHCRSPRFLN